MSSLTTRLVSQKIAKYTRCTTVLSHVLEDAVFLQLIRKRARVNALPALCHNDMKSHQKYLESFSNAFLIATTTRDTASMNVANQMEQAVYCSVLHDWELQRRASDGLFLFVAFSNLSLAVVLFSFAYLLRYICISSTVAFYRELLKSDLMNSKTV